MQSSFHITCQHLLNWIPEKIWRGVYGHLRFPLGSGQHPCRRSKETKPPRTKVCFFMCYLGAKYKMKCAFTYTTGWTFFFVCLKLMIIYFWYSGIKIVDTVVLACPTLFLFRKKYLFLSWFIWHTNIIIFVRRIIFFSLMHVCQRQMV